MDKLFTLWLLLSLFLLFKLPECHGECTIPVVVRGSWFSFEKGRNTITEIDHHEMTNRGYCVAMEKNSVEDVKLLFKDNKCYHCVQLFIRTVNLLEMKQTDCVQFPTGYIPAMEEACKSLVRDQTLITMFNENFVAKNCRSVLEGVWHFTYQNRFSNTGECNHPEAVIRSCQEPGNQFLIANQKFTINYKKCEGVKDSFEGVTEFSCLGDWLDGKNHYFAVANNKESRKEEKYRCFIRNRDDDLYMGHSITPECSVLKTPENSPARFRMTPVKHDNVDPGCLLPQNFTGRWINTAHTEADIIINQTHITEISYPDEGRYRKTVYVCRERRDNRFMMARLNIDGCQTDYVCFDFVPRHHNIIRFRKGLEMIKEDFSTVCSYIQFKSGREWKYDLMLAKDPVPVRCPIAGMFNFTQTGDELLKTRLLGGPTKEPWDGIYCRQNISEFAVCDEEQKEIWIDAEACVTVNAYGQEVDIYTKKPFFVKCPIAGKFNFTQVGMLPLEKRLLGGPPRDPWPGIYCQDIISDFSVCDEGQKEIWIEVQKCISVDSYGRDVDIYSLPDYKLKCIGYWRENLKSYLITYDERDPVSRYRCWVYQRNDLNRIVLSQSVGPSCNLQQTVYAKSLAEGAAVSLSLVEYEREHDRCPMFFDDGSYPWRPSDPPVTVFDFRKTNGGASSLSICLGTFLTLVLGSLLV